ncbi:hypothetical protein RFI_00833, partial [Reticulomyxa filosa]
MSFSHNTKHFDGETEDKQNFFNDTYSTLLELEEDNVQLEQPDANLLKEINNNSSFVDDISSSLSNSKTNDESDKTDDKDIDKALLDDIFKMEQYINSDSGVGDEMTRSYINVPGLKLDEAKQLLVQRALIITEKYWRRQVKQAWIHWRNNTVWPQTPK